MTISQ
ncbi:hypothetical protein YPPY48_2808, partial [Yersinia pestis PY-48]